MIVLKIDNQKILCLFVQRDESQDGWPISYEDSNSTFEAAKAKAKVNRISVDGRMFLYEYVDVNWDMISKFYKNTIPGLSKQNLHFVMRNQLIEKTLKIIVGSYIKMADSLVEEPYKVDKKKKKRAE